MAQFFEIHPDNPQPRLIQQVVRVVQGGGVIVYPTDSSYALGCHIGNKEAQDRMRAIRQLDDRHNFTLVCSDLSQIGLYAQVSNEVYRLLRVHTPGAYTFILRATREVPKRLQNPKRKTIGLRVPEAAIAQALLRELGQPLMSTTLMMPQDSVPLSDPWDIRERLEHQVELVIDGGFCGLDPTTVVDLIGETAVLVRRGKGDPAPFDG